MAEAFPTSNGVIPVVGGPVGSNGCAADHFGQPWFPIIDVHAEVDALSRQIVLPFVAGSLGGSPPTDGIPPRPFVPGGEPDVGTDSRNR